MSEIKYLIKSTALTHVFLFTQKYIHTDLPQIGAILEELVAPWVRPSWNTH